MPDKLQLLSEKVIQINDEENGSYEQLPVKYLSEVITCRTREIIEAILFHIQDSGYADSLRSGMVITGGGANLVNLANFIKQESGYNVRVGYPRTQMFSTGGCPGVGETSAVATLGMILDAKKDYLLNCIDEIPEPVSDTDTTVNEDVDKDVPSLDDKGNGEIFAVPELGDVITTETNTSRRRSTKKNESSTEPQQPARSSLAP